MDRPLNELPLLTKSILMENWDELVTDRNIKLKDVKTFLDGLKEEDFGKLFENKYYCFCCWKYWFKMYFCL